MSDHSEFSRHLDSGAKQEIEQSEYEDQRQRDTANIAMRELVRQMGELEGRIEILATALRDIEAIAQDYCDYDTAGLNRIIHICSTGGVRLAMEPGF